MNTRRFVSPLSVSQALAAAIGILFATFTIWQAGEAFASPEPIKTSTQQEGSKSDAEDLAPSQVSVRKSHVYIFVDKTGFGHQHGIEGRLEGGSLKLGATENAGELVFDMKTFDGDTDSARKYLGLAGSTDLSTRRQVTDNMKGESILNVAQHPTAKFVISSALPSSRKSREAKKQYELIGHFTLRGQTRPLRIDVEVETADGFTHVRGKFDLLQTQYGIRPFRKALGTIGVADQLTIHGDIWIAADAEPSEN